MKCGCCFGTGTLRGASELGALEWTCASCNGNGHISDNDFTHECEPDATPALISAIDIAAKEGVLVRVQPLDTPGKQLVTEQVIADLKARTAVGIKKYGRPLETHNGRDALQDAYEEALDLCQYLKQAILERDSK